jgi:hypothetical protein
MSSLFPQISRRGSVRPSGSTSTATSKPVKPHAINLARIPLPPIGIAHTTSSSESDVPAPLALSKTPTEGTLQPPATPSRLSKIRVASAPMSRSASECISSDGTQNTSDFIRLPDFPTIDFRFSFFFLEPQIPNSDGTSASLRLSQSFEPLLRVGPNAPVTTDSESSADSIHRADSEGLSAQEEAGSKLNDRAQLTGEDQLLQDCDAASRIYSWLPLRTLLKFRCMSADLKDSLTEYIVRLLVDATLDYYTLNNGNYETKLDQWKERMGQLVDGPRASADTTPAPPTVPFPESAYPLFPVRRMASQLVNMECVLQSHPEWGLSTSPTLLALMLTTITDEQQFSLANKKYYGHRLFSMLSSEVVGATRGVLLWPRWCPLYTLFSSWYSAPLLERPLSHVESMIVDIPFRVLYSTQDPLRDPVGPLTSLVPDRLPSQVGTLNSLPPIGLRISEIVGRSAPFKVKDDPVAFRGLPLLANMPSMETSEDQEEDTLLGGSLPSAPMRGANSVPPTSALIMQRLENAKTALPERFPLGLPDNTRDENTNNILLFVGETSTPVLSETLFPLHNGAGAVPPPAAVRPPAPAVFWGAAPAAASTAYNCPYSKSLFVVGIPTLTSVGTRFNIPQLRSVVFAGLTRVDTIGAGFLAGSCTVESVALYNMPALTLIDDSFCSGCSNLQSVSISEHVRTIGKAFLANCLKLRVLDLSETKIEEAGTQFCTGAKQLTTVTFPSTLTNLGEQFLENCAALKALDLSHCQSLGAVPNHFLTNCAMLKRLLLPTPVPKILGPDVLLGCLSLPADTRQAFLTGSGLASGEKSTRSRSKSRPRVRR